MSGFYVNDKGQRVEVWPSGTVVTYQPTTRMGTCAECGKEFIRRAVDMLDDGSLCLDCYRRSKE